MLPDLLPDIPLSAARFTLQGCSECHCCHSCQSGCSWTLLFHHFSSLSFIVFWSKALSLLLVYLDFWILAVSCFLVLQSPIWWDPQVVISKRNNKSWRKKNTSLCLRVWRMNINSWRDGFQNYKASGGAKKPDYIMRCRRFNRLANNMFQGRRRV